MGLLVGLLVGLSIGAAVMAWRERRWLRKVERASGDAEALARAVYGPKGRRR